MARHTDQTIEEIQFVFAKCSLSPFLVAQSTKGICAVFLGHNLQSLAKDLLRRFPNARLVERTQTLSREMALVIKFMESPKTKLDLPLDLRGTKFQQQVWQALRKVPLGSVVSYSDLARSIRNPKAVRAVAQACACNPLAIVVPCHRVLRKDGALSGYRWGVQLKKALLAKETNIS